MERLTKRGKEGVAYWNGANGVHYSDNQGNIYGNAITKLAEYEDAEEQGVLLKLPESDWNDLIKQLATIIANDFIVYSGEREFIANQIFLLEYDEGFRFSATCSCFNGTENDWWCDEECEHGEDGKGCYITFSFSDIGKTIFLTRKEAEAALERMNENA